MESRTSTLSILMNSDDHTHRLSMASAPGNLYWVSQDDIAIILHGFLDEKSLSQLFKTLISLGVRDCIFMPPVESDRRYHELAHELGITVHEAIGGVPISTFETVLESLKKSYTPMEISDFLMNQLINNLICLMSSPYFNQKNLASLVGKTLQRNVYILSKDYNLLTLSQHGVNIKAKTPPLLEWSEKLRVWDSMSFQSVQPFELHHENRPHLCFPLKSGTDVLGYMVIEGEQTHNVPLDLDRIYEILPYFMIVMAKHARSNLSQEKSFEHFLKGALFGYYKDPDSLRREASKFEFPCNENRYVWVLEIRPLSAENDGNQTSLEHILKYAQNLCMKYFYSNIYLTDDKQLISIQIKDGTPDEVNGKRHKKIINQLEMEFPEYQFCMGFSRAYQSFYEISNAYEDAAFSITIGQKIFKKSKNIFYYNDLLAYHLIYNQMNSPILKRLYDNTIRQIKAHDAQKNDTLLETLIELMNNDFNFKETSDSLFIHRNTLYQRISKIESIIGMKIKKTETKLLLHLGIKYNNITNLIH